MNAVVGNIPWSNAERSGEMTRFMALTRGEGSFFYTVSLDPMHNIASSRPFNGRRPSPGRFAIRSYTSSPRSRGVACWRCAARPTSMGEIG